MVIADRSKKRINQQEDMSWYRALTLSERISLWHGNEGRNFSEQEQGELAAQKLQWWKEQEPFNKEGYFAERLAIDGLSEEELSCLLAEPGMSLPEGISERPAWLDRLIQSFTTFDTHASYVLPEIEHAHGIAALLHTVKPLLKNALDQFQGKLYLLVQGQRYLPFEQEMMTSFFMTHLSQLLLWKLSRTMVLELNIARVQERLPGTAPEERFDHFVQQHSQPEVMLALLQRYPVLARQLVLCVDTWQEAVLEFLERLCNDWQEICATFTPEADPGLLVAVSAGAGDAHRRGRSVFILRFNSGFELVYKPRSLAVDIHFQHLLVWVNARSNLPALYCMQLLDKGVYGWSECISSRGCTSPDEVERFYVRQGAYLGLLHALSAVDFHAENLLAAGEHPVLVDLEALFHPHVPRSSAGQSLDPAGETLSSSVLSVGLLPYRMWSNEQKPGIDCSGLGHKSGQIYPQRVPQWSQIGTDQMCLVREYVAFPERQNRPTLHGAEVDLCQYQDAILHGFTQIYRFLMTERDTFLAEIVPLFAHDNIRCILRPTMAYGLLLQDSSHPDVLRDALDLQRYLDRLWIMAEHCPFMKHLIRAECADLLEGDIPYFTARPASKDIWTS
ncbi:MAG TPA: type 2 lanthipeptide synthetase LanM, partial [Ktedonosporobacter sp.]|nr:type 2 lanthipeptide synthetase LanM [Ktedonosporobacter sp.]